MSSWMVLESNAAPAPPESPQDALAQAFVSFTEAAGSLERSYSQLQAEVGRLRAELQQANAELEEQRQAARRVQALAEVSTLLAHEIRNPLGSMELFASLLTESQVTAAQMTWVRQIQAGLRTLAASVNNVLELHADAVTDLVPTDGGELLHWALEFLAPLAEQAGVHLNLRNEIVGVRLRADAHRLQQVILNLVLNAIQVSSESGWVFLSGRRLEQSGEKWLELEISDEGKGISPEQLDHIFEAGFTTRPGGAGLGLAVCKKLIEQHHGQIYVSSVLGEGTTFLIRIPGVEA